MNVWLSWSSGKDSAWALWRLRKKGCDQVSGLFTTVTRTFARVSIHGVREELLKAQTAAVELPLHVIEIPWPCSNREYAAIMRRFLRKAAAYGVEAMAFGDLFLSDVRQYRIDLLKGTSFKPIFPLWRQSTSKLSRQMIRAGLRAKIACLDPTKVPAIMAGREFDLRFLGELPPGVDPCGENGEFHTFVYDGPMFSRPLQVRLGEVVEREGFVFADLIDAKAQEPAGPGTH